MVIKTVIIIQIVISWNVKLYGLYITLFVVIRNKTWRHARNQRRITIPPDYTYTRVIDNVVPDSVTDSRQTCSKVSLLTRMRDVNSAADETISS